MDDERLNYLVTFLRENPGGFADHCVLKSELLGALMDLRRLRDMPLHCPDCNGDHL